MMKFWKLAFHNLQRNRRRNFATISSIGFGLIGLMMFGGYVNRTDNFLRVYTTNGLKTGHLSIYAQDGLEKFLYRPQDYSFTLAQQEQIEKILKFYQDDIELHTKSISGSGLAGNGCQSFPFSISSVEPLIDKKMQEHEETLYWAPELSHFLKGRGMWEYRDSLSPLYMSKGLSRLLHKPLVYDEVKTDNNHSPVQIVDCTNSDAKKTIEFDSNIQLLVSNWSGTISAADGEIVAQFSTGFSETDQGALIGSLSYIQNLFGTDHVSHYSIWLQSPEKINSFIKKIKQKMKEAHLAVDIYPWNDRQLSPIYNGAMTFLSVMITFIGIVLSAIIALSILNAATMTVTERSNEIGVMQALGFSHNEIKQIFVQEAFLVGTIGIISGFFLGKIIIYFINQQRIPYTPPGASGEIPLLLIPDLKFIILVSGLTLTLNFITTWWVVGQVSKKNISHLIMGHHG